MNDFENIDEYLEGRMEAGAKRAFEARLVADPGLAEQVAFFLQARHAARQAALLERHAEWVSLRRPEAAPPRTRVIRIAYASLASAAAVVLLLWGWWSFFRPTAATPERLADAYVQKNFSGTLSLLMSGRTDSLQTALSLANDGKNREALTMLTDLTRRDPTNAEAKNYAGIVALRAGDYDQAIAQFHALSQQPGLFSNPGAFHEAIARLKRGQPLDKKTAKTLLETVVRENLEGHEEAAKWLEDWR
jgi:tetratricopeptide (TPR) repeat protein